MVVGRVLAYRDWDNSCNILMVSDCLLAVHLFPSEPSESKPQLPVPCYGALETIGVVEGLWKPLEWWRYEIAARYTLMVSMLKVSLRWATNRAAACLLARQGCRWSCLQNAVNLAIPTL